MLFRSALVVVAVCNCLINFLIIEAIFIIFLLLTGQLPGWVILAIIPLMLLQLWLSTALLVILAILNVFFRDVASITSIAVQFIFWLTPIVYAPSMIPQRFLAYLQLNPLTKLFESYQIIFVQHKWPSWYDLWPIIVLSAVLTWVAAYLYKTHSGELVDQL